MLKVSYTPFLVNSNKNVQGNQKYYISKMIYTASLNLFYFIHV